MTSQPKQPIYSFLSIGQRGVGKTVFLAACYLESHQDTEQQRLLWFDCEDRDARRTIDNLLVYVAKTGEYPPATLKITNFEFLLKQRSQWGHQTLGQVRWWDVPGESCHVHNPAFTSMLNHSDGCCLFLDAPSLVQNADDPASLTKLLQPLESVVALVVNQGLSLPLAIILTKCDQLPPHPLFWQRLKKALNPLVTRLQEWQANYQLFYSEIPITEIDGVLTLQLTRVGTPIYWLFSNIHRSCQGEMETVDPQIPYYIPTPLPPWFHRLLGGKLTKINPINIPHHEVFLIILLLMALFSLGVAVVLQQDLFPKSETPQQNSLPQK
jgi:hypothetical protein